MKYMAGSKTMVSPPRVSSSMMHPLTTLTLNKNLLQKDVVRK